MANREYGWLVCRAQTGRTSRMPTVSASDSSTPSATSDPDQQGRCPVRHLVTAVAGPVCDRPGEVGELGHTEVRRRARYEAEHRRPDLPLSARPSCAVRPAALVWHIERESEVLS